MIRRSCAPVLTCVTVVTLAAAQPPELPLFRIGADLVVVDLIARDRDGNLVADLQPSDVHVREDGRPQKVQFVRLVRGPGARDAQDDERPDAPAGGVGRRAVADSAMEAAQAGLVVLAVDLGSMPPDAWPRVRESMASMVRDDLPPGVPVMVASLGRGVTIRQAFTPERARLLAAIDGLPATLTGHLTIAEIVEQTEHVCDTAGEKGLAESAVGLGRALLIEARQRIAGASEGLATLARLTAGAPGRKHVVLYSAGYFMNPVGDVVEAVAASVATCSPLQAEQIRSALAQDLASSDSADAVSRVQAAIDRANRAQVSVYAIDPRGLVTTSAEARQRTSARAARGGALQKFLAIDQVRSQQYLRTVAGETGGRAFLNSNDLALGLRAAWQDATEYYLVGYTPSGARRKGRFHRIELKINRPEVAVLRYRQGYHPATEQELAQADVAAALRDAGAFTRDGFDVETSLDGGTLRVIAYVPPAAIRFSPAGQAFRGEFSIHAALYDAKGALVAGKPLFGRDVALQLTAERLAEFREFDNVEIRTDATAPAPGTYTLTVAVRDSSGWIGARTVEMAVEP